MSGFFQGMQSAVASVTGPADPNAEITRLEGEVTTAKTALAELEQQLQQAKDKAQSVGLAAASSSDGVGGRRRRKTRKLRRSRSGRKSTRS